MVMATMLNAQFINNGATVIIQSGAILTVDSDLENNSGGTITNNGTLEVSGDFSNDVAATLTPSAGLIRFFGTANTDLDTGGDALNDVEMAKTGASGQLTLLSDVTIDGDLDFTGTGNNKILLGTWDLNMSSASATVTASTDHPTNGWVATNSTGEFVKATSAGDVAKNMEIGSATSYTPVQVNMTGTSAGDVSALTRSTGLNAKYSEADAYIDREWIVSTPTVTSTTLTGTYVAGDVTGTASLIYGCTYDSGEWDFDGTGQAANTVIASTTGNTAEVLSGQNFFGKASLKVYLAGSMPGNNTPPMRKDLNSILPLTTPYNVAPFNAPTVTASSIPSAATDWILLEVRDATTPSTIISKTSAFILDDGYIINYDGSSLRLKDAVTNGHIAVKHRNHLAIRTNSPLDLVNPSLHDFTTGTGQAYTDPAITSNANMRLMGSVYCLWNGDTNQNGQVLYAGSGNDSSPILSKVGGTSNATNPSAGYFKEDVDLNGSVLYAGSGNDRSKILSAVGGTGNATTAISQHLN